MAEIGMRIRSKREELGITQEDLANLLGYKNKSTIAKIENGTNDIPQSKVIEFARALHTTVSFLMDLEGEEVMQSSLILSDFESKIISEYRKSDTLTKAMVLRTLAIDEKPVKKGANKKWQKIPLLEECGGYYLF